MMKYYKSIKMIIIYYNVFIIKYKYIFKFEDIF